MPEDMNLEFAYKLSEDEQAEDAEDRRKHRWQVVTEVAEVLILAIVAVATAWSGYQAARWDGRQALLYGNSQRLRFEAEALETLGGQQRLLDVSTFNTWIQAEQDGDTELADLYVRRFSDEYRVAFEAWLETDPFENPDAPPGPSFMPEYHNPQSERAEEINQQAGALFLAGSEAREIAERYVRQTVLFATVLFLVAIGQRFRFRAVRIAAAVIAGSIMILALVGVFRLPRL
ncbi:MAG TPA: hypothetical protein VIC58_12810 [Actinomycetota bacterium]|jgi:hypothetical protein